MVTISKVITKLDYLGMKPPLYINGSTSFHTLFGGTLTLFVITISITAMIFFSQELWLRRQPTVNLSTESVLSPPPYKIDKDHFEFFIKVQNPFNPSEGFIDDSIYYVQGVIYITNNNSPIQIPLNLEPCNVTSFTDENYNLLKSFNFKGAWCLSKNQTINPKDLVFQGIYGQSDFHMLYFKFFLCQNSTSNNNSCSTPSRINSFLSNSYVGIYMINNNLQTNNFNDPSTKTVSDYFFLVSNQNYASVTLYFNRILIYSDVGIVFETINKTETFATAHPITYTNQMTTNRFCSISIQISGFIQNYYRTYLKLQNILATVGGILNLTQIIFLMIYWNYNNHFMLEELFNSYFSQKYDDLDSPELIKHKIKHLHAFTEREELNNYRKKNESIPESRNEIILSQNMPRRNMKKFIQKVMNKRHSEFSVAVVRKFYQKNITKFSFIDALFCIAIFQCHKRKKDKSKIQIFLKGVDIITDKLSIKNLLRVIMDVDKLKFLMLDEKQLTLFDLIKNPPVLHSEEQKSFCLNQYLVRNLNSEFSDVKQIESNLQEMLNRNDNLSLKLYDSFQT